MIKFDNSAARDRYQFFDTQVVSYAFKEIPNAIEIRGGAISSIAASEFLLLQGNDLKRANYYIPLPLSNMPYDNHIQVSHVYGLGHVKGPRNKRSRPLQKPSIDSIVMEFGREHEPIIEYSNRALSNIINNKRINVFRACIEHLDKEKQKMLRKRCQFLLDNELQCIPLNKEILDQSFLLLHEFMQRYSVKQNFRNSWNDILILATSLLSNADLVTKDSNLSRFATEQYALPFTHMDPFLHLSFGKVEMPMRRASRESKGYINRGWKARFHHYK